MMMPINDTFLPPKELVDMVKTLKYKEGWSFGVEGPYLVVRIVCEDSTGRIPKDDSQLDVDPFFSRCFGFQDIFMLRQRPHYIVHTIEIPRALNYMVDSIRDIRRWLMDTIIRIETHEACEFFKLPMETGGYYAPFFPHSEDHGVYAVVDKTPDGK